MSEFRKMRLQNQQLSKEETEQILRDCSNGTLALFGENDYPYSVPISYVYDDGKIYFHGANEGYKYDCLTKNPHASFSVIALDDVQPEMFTTKYKSVILYGQVKISESEADMQRACELIIKKYCNGNMEGGMKLVRGSLGKMCVYELSIEHMTGKEGE